MITGRSGVCTTNEFSLRNAYPITSPLNAWIHTRINDLLLSYGCFLLFDATWRSNVARHLQFELALDPWALRGDAKERLFRTTQSPALSQMIATSRTMRQSKESDPSRTLVVKQKREKQLSDVVQNRSRAVTTPV
jgi:hypothetical protein